LFVNALEVFKSSQAGRLSFGFSDVDHVFPGFALGEFVVFQGHPSHWLSHLLCIRCQLPEGLGGLNSPALFLDGGNSFDLYGISGIARRHRLQPRDVLDHIFVSRAFTAYQMTSMILDKLEHMMDETGAKLVILSNLDLSYHDDDIPKTESYDLFNKLTLYLSGLASKRKAIIVATHSLHRRDSRSPFLENTLIGRAHVVFRITDSSDSLRFVLEKHPVSRFEVVEPHHRGVTLDNFFGA
jgi:hypothetical protein